MKLKVGLFRVEFLLAVQVALQCLSWCHSYETETQVESCERENRGKRFLKSEWDVNAQAFKISFTGRKVENGTKFIFSSKWISYNNRKTMQFTLRPAAFPNYILVAEKDGLVMKNLSNVDVADRKHSFTMSTVSLQYDNRNMTYKLLRTRSRPLRVLKSSKSGNVFLDKWRDWKDCQAWFKL